jgi:DNA-binding transcriptional LysR family regulator
MLNLNHIKSYSALLRSGSYHEAARRLNLSQSTISQHIKKMESALGATLVVRNRNGCSMAPRTETFARYAEALNRLAEKAWNALRNPRMTVGASTNIGTYLLQPTFKEFYEANRESLNLELIIDRNDRIANLLESDEVDVAVMEWWDDRPGFVCQPWKTESLVVIVPSGHPWCARESILPQELVGEKMIGGESASGTGRLLSETLGDLMSGIEVKFKLGNTEAVKKAVQAGLGVSIVLASSVIQEIKDGSLKSIRIDGTRIEKELMVIHRRGLPADSVIVKFAEKLKTEQLRSTMSDSRDRHLRRLSRPESAYGHNTAS